MYTITWKEKVIVPRHSKKVGPGCEAESTSHHAAHYKHNVKQGLTTVVALHCRPVGRGVRGGSLEPPFWPPKDYICTT